jgi:hypothetical protein
MRDVAIAVFGLWSVAVLAGQLKPDDHTPSIFTAVEEQLGLKPVPDTAPVDWSWWATSGSPRRTDEGE